MPKFMFEARYSAEGAKGIAEKGGSARVEAVRQAFDAAGGKLESFHFAFGDADVYAIGELPDNETATALALTINADGRTKVKTVVLLTPEQVDAATSRSVEYRGPGG
jgi:uncharacterized protein with GYD domain